jgi:hypothetical protein
MGTVRYIVTCRFTARTGIRIPKSKASAPADASSCQQLANLPLQSAQAQHQAGAVKHGESSLYPRAVETVSTTRVVSWGEWSKRHRSSPGRCKNKHPL